MTEADTILKLIEEVDPSDTAKMDEINSAVRSYLGVPETWGNRIIEYTCSLDALKAIEPDGWDLEIRQDVGHKAFCQFSKCNQNYAPTAQAATEHLARLHVIIQAISHDRKEQK